MYSIDYVFADNDYRKGEIIFTHDYLMLINVLNLNVDTSILDEYVIDASNDEYRVYGVNMLNDQHYEAFVWALNQAIMNVDVSIDVAVNDKVCLFVNGAIRGMIDHISDEDIDMLSMTHIVDYFHGNDVDIESANMNEIGEMISRFVYVVRIMNGEGY